ncbi:DUF512 domain-containing protein [Desulfitibacter alkalitolerans]|uniref:DUF512 domain-containing protein n=1 Tax=Desulfitibacter alkalitolerans TaxID=264641 RepID=UPI000556F17A|nr:DUF512 domain-containing protein [Desulfitibacter alkalitolerans]
MGQKKVYNSLIRDVKPNSIAEEINIQMGDRLKKINGKPLRDILDYYILTENDYILLEIEKENGQIWEIEIEKDFHEPLGISFKEECFDGLQKCQNNCIFCFLKGLPRGMRKSLYVKDDDYRHSFLHGNYITLTNVDWYDLKRIVDYKLAPLYISVHSTNPELRVRMLGNNKAADLNEKLKYLAEHGITMHTQIVLCPGLNDSKELDRTINDLSKLWPWVSSLAVVPVGLTKYNYLANEYLRQFNVQESNLVINKIKNWQNICLKKYNTRFVFPSDEFFIRANLEIPAEKEYEGYPQLENGVGLVRSFVNDFKYYFREKGQDGITMDRAYVIVTGEAAFPILDSLVKDFLPSDNVRVIQIKNSFFGYPVSVTGLLTGSDIIKGLKDIPLNNCILLISDVLLKKDHDIFLDNMTISELEKNLDLEIQIIPNSGSILAKTLTGGE